MIRINLLPVREARQRASLRQQGMLLGAALVAAIVISGLLHTAIAAQLSSERQRVVAAQAELAKLEETLKEVERFRGEKEDIEQKLSIIARLEESRRGPVRIMDEIATRIPDRMWLSRMKLSGGALELEGFGIDNEVIAAFLTSLEQSKFLTNVELKQSQLTTKHGLKLNAFKIRASDTLTRAAMRAAASAESGKQGRARR